MASLSMEVIARLAGAIYLRLPRELQLPAGECSCDYCLAHPNAPAMWDTLAVPLEASRNDYSWTVHMPDPAGFLKAVREAR